MFHRRALRSVRVPFAGAAAAYAGPGDVTSGWIFWAGMRAFSLAKATTPTNAIQLRYTDTTLVTYQTQADGTINLTASGSSNAASHATNITNHGGPATIATWYDQSPSANHAVQSTTAAQPTFTLSVVGGFPGATFAGSQVLVTTSAVTQTQPFGFSSVYNNTSGTQAWLMTNTGNLGLISTSSATLAVYAGSALEAHAAANNVFHATNSTVLNGAGNSNAYVDGTDSVTGVLVGTNDFGAQVMGIGDAVPTNSPFTGVLVEAGLFNGSLQSARAALNTQQHTRYGF